MKSRSRLSPSLGLAAVGLAFLLALPAAAEKPGRLQPTRIYSTGDSITTAFDSNYLLENPSESWVNGYFGLLQDLLGFENVNSHFQRADAAFGVVSNVNGARNGADMDDFAGQAQAGLASNPYYVTLEMGGNDVCKDSFAEVTPPIDYLLQMIDGVQVLEPKIFGLTGGLAPGATVYTASIPDIKQLYDVGKNESGIFGLDCETIWLTTLIGFPCGSMLSPVNTEQDRLNLQQVNLVYNLLLELAANAVNDLSPDQYWDYTWSVWNYQVQGSDISSIDCFHPSSDGQRALSEGTWADGPFSAF